MKKLIVFLLMFASTAWAGSGGEVIEVIPSIADYSGKVDSIWPDQFIILYSTDSAGDSTFGTFYTSPVPVFDYGAMTFSVNCFSIQERDSGNVWVQASGSGDHDLRSGGTYTGTQDTVIYVKIAAEGTPDTYVFSIGDTAAGTDSFSVAPDTIEIDSATHMTLGLGKTVYFFDDDNHDADDVFTLNCYANGYPGYAWNDTTPGSTFSVIQAQTFDDLDSISAVGSVVALQDTGVAELWLGKGNGFVGSDSLKGYVRLEIKILDSLSSALKDTANQQFRNWYKITAQRKR